MSEAVTKGSSESVIDLLKSHYPARYYGMLLSGADTLDQAFDVWSAVDVNGRPLADLTTLPAASALVPLTAEQFALVVGADHVWVDPQGQTLTYPGRYYARYDTTAAQPTIVTGWFDTWTLTTTANIGSAADMVPLSSEAWNARASNPWGVQSGQLVSYTPPPPVIPLKDQATSELSWISTQASMASAMGETFTDPMKVYVKAIQAIANGTDTTSTALPARPAMIMN